MKDHCGHCDITSGPSEDCPQHGRNTDCPKCGVGTKIVERDPDVYDRRCPQCGDWLKLVDDPPPCPDCDHEPEDHDTQGCRGYTPSWPRLVRCGCTQTKLQTVSDDERDAYSRGVASAYSAVFAAFTRAFDAEQDIHWLRERISAQWADLRATGIVRGVL